MHIGITKQIVARLIALILVIAGWSSSFAQVGPDSMDGQFQHGTEYQLNPSIWLHQGHSTLLNAENRLLAGIDTSYLVSKFPRLIKDFSLTQNNFALHGSHMRIRDLEDTRAKLLQQLGELNHWSLGMRKLNDSISADFLIVQKLMKDTIHQYVRRNPTLWNIYGIEFLAADSLLRKVDTMYEHSLQSIVRVETDLNRASYRVNLLKMSVDSELRLRNSELYKRTHPPVWKLHANTYPEGIVKVATRTVRQNIDSLTFYGKNAYIRAILFRLLLLIITLLPIWFFRKNKDRFSASAKDSPFRFVHKYTGASTSSFVMIIAPFVFINAPHIFLEAILVTLAVTTSIIFFKENPSVGKRNMYLLLAIYVLLKVMNLMVSVTLFGRIVWTLSIIALLPLYQILRNIPSLKIRYINLWRIILMLTIVMFIVGWVLSFTGHYPLGRILLLAGLDQFFLAIILYVAIFSFIDFVTILADMYNSSSHVTTVRVELIYRKLLNLARALAIIFWFWSFIQNINADEFLRSHFFNLLSQTISIGSYALSPWSILVFFMVLYLSFYLSGLLDGLFYDEKRSNEAQVKTSLGSIVLLLRLFILSLGFVIGMIFAGIPLNNISLFFGALGVGIGFGLQGLIANLISGIIIAFEKPVYVGDIVEVEGQRGRVTDIGLRSTKVDTSDGAEYVIPNGTLVGQVLKNWTLSNKHFKIETVVDLDHETNPEQASALIQLALQDEKAVLQQPTPKVQLTEITPYALRFFVSCWVRDIADGKQIKSQLLTKIHMSLIDAGILYARKNRDEKNS